MEEYYLVALKISFEYSVDGVLKLNDIFRVADKYYLKEAVVKLYYVLFEFNYSADRKRI